MTTRVDAGTSVVANSARSSRFARRSWISDLSPCIDGEVSHRTGTDYRSDVDLLAESGGPIVHALRVAAGMTWEILWALVLGFALSGAVQAVVSKTEMTRLLPDDSRRSLTRATLLGAASSSCSYAAVALARSIFRKGADFTSAMAFQFASTNLVIELGIILAVLMGWEFTLAEFVGGPIMIVLLALLFRRFLTTRLRDAALAQAEQGVAGSMEGHAAMDMSVTGDASFARRMFSARGFTSVSHNLVMEW